MEKDIYITEYIEKLRQLFTEYKANPSSKSEKEILEVVVNFTHLGYKLPLENIVWFDSKSRKLFKELFDSKGIPLSEGTSFD